MTRAMILCAGFGSRLGSLSQTLPKPLLPVCQVPILRYGITHLVASGITDIVINLHHKSHLISDEIGDGSSMGARVQYSMEEDILGTGGGIKKALPLLDPDLRDEPFISLNGKLIFDLDIPKLLAFHDSETLGTMVVQRVADPLSWGAVDVDDSAQVKNILGQGQYMFCGVHVSRPSVFAKIPEGEACTVRQGYLPWIQKGGVVRAYAHEKGYFAEHSNPKRYLESNVALLDQIQLSHPPDLLREVSPDAKIHPGATLVPPVSIAQGAKIDDKARVGPHVVLGADSVVESGVEISRVVAWPKARVTQSGHSGVVTEQGWVDASADS